METRSRLPAGAVQAFPNPWSTCGSNRASRYRLRRPSSCKHGKPAAAPTRSSSRPATIRATRPGSNPSANPMAMPKATGAFPVRDDVSSHDPAEALTPASVEARSRGRFHSPHLSFRRSQPAAPRTLHPSPAASSPSRRGRACAATVRRHLLHRAHQPRGGGGLAEMLSIITAVQRSRWGWRSPAGDVEGRAMDRLEHEAHRARG